MRLSRPIGKLWALAAALLAVGVSGVQAEAPYETAWIHQLGSANADYPQSVSADDLGGVYIGGFTAGSLGGPNAGQNDVFLSKFDAAGNLLWTRQFGTEGQDWGLGLSPDGLGNVYITGYTYGSLGGPSAGYTDAFLSKLDAAGNLLWSRQFGTEQNDSSSDVSADGLGSVYVCGATEGSLGGPNAGGNDVFLSKFDAAGNLLWSRQFGTAAADAGKGMSPDGLGNVYVTGYTQGSLGGPSAGDYDAFVAKFVPVAEPSTMVGLVSLGIVGLLACARRRRQFGDP